MSKKAKDITGLVFGKLTVIRTYPVQSGRAKWQCQCECGTTKIITGDNLLTGNTTSCGCIKPTRTHGLNGQGVEISWRAMLNRCYNQKHPKFHNYGGAGITVCEFIRATPANLLSLIGPRPEEQSLDRISGLFGYTCGQCAECLERGWALNVRWATAVTQNRNRKTSRMVTIEGVTKCVAEWAESSQVNVETIRARLRGGMTGTELLKKVIL